MFRRYSTGQTSGNANIAALSCIVASCCIEGKKPPEDGCMEPKHVVEEEQEI
jgi:hypothetical protein